MKTDRELAHGRSAHALVSYLNGRRVKALSMIDAPQHFGVPQPRTKEEAAEAIKLLLAPCVGEMLYAGGRPESHIALDRPEVRKALDIAGKLGPGDRVDHLENAYSELSDTLTSPRLWAGVCALASALLRHRSMGGERVAQVLKGSLMSGQPKGAVHPQMRRIFVTDGPAR
jgi:hypothetical protein